MWAGPRECISLYVFVSRVYAGGGSGQEKRREEIERRVREREMVTAQKVEEKSQGRRLEHLSELEKELESLAADEEKMADAVKVVTGPLHSFLFASVLHAFWLLSEVYLFFMWMLSLSLCCLALRNGSKVSRNCSTVTFW